MARIQHPKFDWPFRAQAAPKNKKTPNAGHFVRIQGLFAIWLFAIVAVNLTRRFDGSSAFFVEQRSFGASGMGEGMWRWCGLRLPDAGKESALSISKMALPVIDVETSAATVSFLAG